MPNGTLEVAAFSKPELIRRLGDGYSVEYLNGYLEELQAQSILVESHYIDRHYLDEFAHYYSRSFNAPPSWCSRIHFFQDISADALNSWLDSAYQSPQARDEAEAQLRLAYLGFVVRRPLSGASVGRTVLKTYPIEGRRHYEVIRPYGVNIAGIRLEVQGLAYQQQDRGAAVCASTALWSALQRVAYVAGNRTPTPMAITHAAQSPFPASSGLSMPQMAVALSSLGYVADAFAPRENRNLFRAKLVTFLRSHLPVVLLLVRKRDTGRGFVRDGHAVTVTGFSEPKAIVDVSPASENTTSIRMRDGSVDVIYVHDDNLGSHAHYELVDDTEEGEDGHKRLKLLRGRAGDASPKHAWWKVDEWIVDGALVPKPAKMRLPIDSLFGAMFGLKPLLERVFEGLELDYVAYEASGVEYKRQLVGYDLSREHIRDFMSALTLPRHVGVIRVCSNERHLCDVLIDVTEVQRNNAAPSVLGVAAPGVAFLSIAHSNLARVAAILQSKVASASRWQVITGPARDVATDVAASSDQIVP
ncbi:hypothetical protein WME89_47475 [Sorangium sp. So ce321]|uniref:hypothetical protein n=1 Tax=Sorangium sp. So ce321 TaxID=3133300 RepID=UPI003F5DBA8C